MLRVWHVPKPLMVIINFNWVKPGLLFVKSDVIGLPFIRKLHDVQGMSAYGYDDGVTVVS